MGNWPLSLPGGRFAAPQRGYHARRVERERGPSGVRAAAKRLSSSSVMRSTKLCAATYDLRQRSDENSARVLRIIRRAYVHQGQSGAPVKVGRRRLCHCQRSTARCYIEGNLPANSRSSLPQLRKGLHAQSSRGRPCSLRSWREVGRIMHSSRRLSSR